MIKRSSFFFAKITLIHFTIHRRRYLIFKNISYRHWGFYFMREKHWDWREIRQDNWRLSKLLIIQLQKKFILSECQSSFYRYTSTDICSFWYSSKDQYFVSKEISRYVSDTFDIKVKMFVSFLSLSIWNLLRSEFVPDREFVHAYSRRSQEFNHKEY